MKISKTLGASLLTVALITGPVCAATAAPTQAAGTQAPASSTLLDLFKESDRQRVIDIFDSTNEFRATKGLSPLKFNATIAAISQRWSSTMSTNGYRHNDNFVADAPAGWDRASENIAMTTFLASGKTFVDMWINSPGHNANMSSADDEYIGIGIVHVDSASYATQNFFSYQEGVVLPGSYSNPRDFFNGKPALPRGSVVLATAPAPTWDLVKRTYTIPDVEGVDYVVGSRYEVNMKKAPGTYAADEGHHTFSAGAKPGYVLTNYKTYWDTTFGYLWVAPKVPVFDKTARTVTIPVSNGVQYQLNGNIVAAGVHKFHDVAKVEARSAHGYWLSGNLIWTVTVPLTKVVATAPTFDKKAGTYTIPNQAGVEYVINSKPFAPGTYKSSEYVYVSARAAMGYIMTGAPEWVLRPGLDNAYAGGPFFADYSNLFLIPSDIGVQYYLNGSAVEGGRYTGTGKVTVTATAKSGYRIENTPVSWSYDYTPPAVKMAATAPTFNRLTGQYTVPAKASVQYHVDGKAVTAGTYSGNSRLVVVSAKAATGYTLSGTSSWTYDFRRAVTPAKPAMSSVTNRYTIPAKSGVQYHVDGKATKPGTYSVANGKTVKFTVTATVSTYRLTGTTAWSYRF
ncbi:CAP domain-containing protein [Pseudarthrobacter sp. H2]|uniref:CAP domain-containing protein n=1 Tax=Pseudarthrobacter sp. H2 TaxID=3418415 RepID=UPI003CEC0D23